MPRDVEEFSYPSKVTLGGVLKGMWGTSKMDVFFHGLMAVLLVTGLLIDLVGPLLGGSLASSRLIHGYLGAVYVVAFVAYLTKILVTKKTRMLMTGVNYFDFAAYLVLIVSGIVVSAPSYPWNVYIPGLAVMVYPFAPIASALHTITTYLFMLVSILVPGGFLHGIASAYLIGIKGRSEG